MKIYTHSTIYQEQTRVYNEAVQTNKLDIGEHNSQVYLELVKDMFDHKHGLFSFVIQMNAGEIVSYVIAENFPPESFIDEPITAQTGGEIGNPR